MKLLLTMCLLSLILGCGTVQPSPTPAFTCATACAHGAVLGCDWAIWIPTVGPCETQCVDWVATWGYDMQCMTTVATCAEAEGCQGHAYGLHRLAPKR